MHPRWREVGTGNQMNTGQRVKINYSDPFDALATAIRGYYYPKDYLTYCPASVFAAIAFWFVKTRLEKYVRDKSKNAAC